MIETKTAKMQDRVAKLLRQAEDVAGTPEEAVFQAKAFELMAKYGIEQSQVEAARAGLDVAPDAIRKAFRVEGKYQSAQMVLLTSIARALHCSTVYENAWSSGQKILAVHIFGMERHIERVEMLWKILQPQMMRQVDVVRPLYRDNVKSYRRAWIAGFGSTIGARLNEQETKAVESAGGGALVLYRGDAQRAELAQRQAYPRLRHVKAKYDRSGLSDGQAAGRRASLQHSLAS